MTVITVDLKTGEVTTNYPVALSPLTELIGMEGRPAPAADEKPDGDDESCHRKALRRHSR